MAEQDVIPTLISGRCGVTLIAKAKKVVVDDREQQNLEEKVHLTIMLCWADNVIPSLVYGRNWRVSI